MIYCDAGSVQGGRFLDIDDADTPVDTRHRDEFARNLQELLLEGTKAMGSPGYRRRRLRFGKEAARSWIRYYNYVEEQRQPGGRYEKMGDYASKLADKVARMAADFHVCERFEGDEVGMECLMCAVALCSESSRDHATRFTKGDPLEEDAMRLYDWLLKELRNAPARGAGRIQLAHDFTYVRDVSRYAPARRMRGRNIHALLAILVNKGLVRVWFQYVRRGQTVERIELLDRPHN